MTPKGFLGFSLFGSGSYFNFGDKKVEGSLDAITNELTPTLQLQTDKDVYRPGDSVVVTVEIRNPSFPAEVPERENAVCSLLVERLTFEIKGVEKLDTQWFATQKPLPGSKHKRGEHVFLECSTPSIVSNQFVSCGTAKTYVVRTVLPNIIPPSYRGATIRYLYYVRSTLSGRYLVLENGRSHSESMKDLSELVGSPSFSTNHILHL